MAQLRTLDTAFLRAHDPDQRASLAIGAVAIVDGAIPRPEELKRLLAERVTSIPHYAQLLRAPDLDWVDHPNFALTDHLHHAAVARPGGDAELSRAVARALERPLDLSRPPWECWVIQGLRGNRWAIVLKVHHCLADGHSAAHLLARLCDDADGEAFDDVAPKPVSAPTRETPGWTPALVALRRASALTGALAGAALPMWPGPRAAGARGGATPRRYRSVRVPIADVDTVCRKFGVTADDVALAALTEGFRAALLGRGEQPRADSLRTLAPLRAGPTQSAMLSHLPVEHDDPVQRLRSVHRRRRASETGLPEPGGILESALNLIPNPLRTNLFQLLARLPQRGIVSLATSAPGPRRQLRLMGRTMERLLPIPPTAAQLTTGVAVLSYGDELVFGITADDDAPYDVKQLVAGIELGMERLVALSQDSVLLFGDEHRRRRALRERARLAGHPSASGQARR
ncbi:diacylglycerol O-acyltransferase [Mycobacterium saskatchewanense]|uniref:diacylglycerol O-acyltransferase n=1 Tax=Mycobacterium saskatchewanense TaxID=220927 RepID=A0AAJ3NS24_9MYCO|nr:wax ester/triacylglycerol synthase domain-containing protein [Mycobacterium saskatchewanense]ORW72009.1 diacylglycerol O-acyltransferase [Mycobacterium saskatchewanense]BBX65497.1 diacylglycerol O-acyltransferase [Mycobacterium saskatchewanense]